MSWDEETERAFEMPHYTDSVPINPDDPEEESSLQNFKSHDYVNYEMFPNDSAPPYYAMEITVNNELGLISDPLHHDEAPIPPLLSLDIVLQREPSGGVGDRESTELIQEEITKMYETEVQRKAVTEQQPIVSANKKEKKESKKKDFSCLHAVPVGSLMALIFGLFGLSVFGGGLKFGLATRSETSSQIIYVDYAIYSLLSFYFVYMIFHFIISVLSNSQNKRNLFRRKNFLRCGRGMNTLVTTISFISVLVWTVLFTFISKPVIDGVLASRTYDFLDSRTYNNLTEKFNITNTLVDDFIHIPPTFFKVDIYSKYYNFFQCMCVALFGNLFVICGLIQFIICSAINYASLPCRKS